MVYLLFLKEGPPSDEFQTSPVYSHTSSNFTWKNPKEKYRLARNRLKLGTRLAINDLEQSKYGTKQNDKRQT